MTFQINELFFFVLPGVLFVFGAIMGVVFLIFIGDNKLQPVRDRVFFFWRIFNRYKVTRMRFSEIAQ